jgi:hypothetical protein
VKRFDVEQWLLDNLDSPKHSRGSKGVEITANCPNAACGKRKFYANIDSGKFVCFACDFHGRSIVALIAEVQNLSWSEASAFVFRGSVEMRRRETIFSLKERVRALRPDAIPDETPNYVDVPPPSEFRPVWTKKGGWDFPLYLKKERGISGATAKAWGLGYCVRGDYKYRLVIPYECPNGRCFTARDMTGTARQKYMNPSADTSRLLIGWNTARLTGDLVICEGPLDAVKLYQHDVSALALGGKILHDAQLNMLAKAVPPSTAITVLLDPEEEQAPQDLAARLASYFDSIYIAKLPDGVDPGDSTREQAHDAIENAEKWKGGKHVRVRLAVKRVGAYMDRRWI